MVEQRQQMKEAVYLLTQSFGYLFAGLFFLTTEAEGCFYCWLQLFGYIFLATSIFLVASPLSNKMTKWADRADAILYNSLNIATLALVVKTIADLIVLAQNHKELEILPVVVLVWVLIFVAVRIFLVIKRFH